MLCGYLDANVTIYFVQKVAPCYPGIRRRMTDAQGQPKVQMRRQRIATDGGSRKTHARTRPGRT